MVNGSVCHNETKRRGNNSVSAKQNRHNNTNDDDDDNDDQTHPELSCRRSAWLVDDARDVQEHK